MSGTTTPRPQPRTGQLDETVRGLLRCFLSPGIADKVAGALQPVAHEDREVALRAAAELLGDRFGVQHEDLAAALVDDLEHPVEEVAELLGMTPTDVHRVTAIDPPDVSLPPTPERRAAAPGRSVQPEPDEIVADWVPAPDDGQQLRSVGVAAALVAGMAVVVVAVTLAVVWLARDTDDATAVGPAPDESAASVDDEQPDDEQPDDEQPDDEQPDDEQPADDDEPAASDDPTASDEPASPAPTSEPTPASTSEPTPTASDEQVATPTTLRQLRFVTDVDPVSGEAGASSAEVGIDEDVRAWARLAPPSTDELMVEMTFTAPDGSRATRSLRLTSGIDVLAVRLPEDLGREVGRYVVEAVLPRGEGPMLRAEVRLVAPAA